MKKKVLSGLDQFANDTNAEKKYSGNIGLLCHSASVDGNIKHAIEIFVKKFGKRFTKIFGPQHGIVSDVQDNMVETDHGIHPHFKLPVYSLYSETRCPTDSMLQDLDYVFIDLQDVGTRIYTYIYTMTYMLEACAKNGVKVVVLDRPNPVNANTVEGNVLEETYSSFVGRHPLPVRHGLTIGEVAKMHQTFWATQKCELEIISMQNYSRTMSFEDTQLPWVLPSPNLPTVDAAYTFVGTVLFEGTNISEGRGTSRPLEIIGHPAIDPWQLKEHLDAVFQQTNLSGFYLRPANFLPTFQKHGGQACGGFQIHVTDRNSFMPWRVCQILCREFYHYLGPKFAYKTEPYEYELEKNPIDLINGTNRLREWYESNGPVSFLDAIESESMQYYLDQRKQILLY